MESELRPIEKKVDERWKEEVEREKRLTQRPSAAPPSPPSPVRGEPVHRQAPPPEPEPEPESDSAMPEPNFAVFLSSLSMQAMIALGELPLPGTNQHHEDLEQARYLIDALAMLQAKTTGNLTAEEAQFLENALYELRMRYAQKVAPPIPPPPGGRR